MSNINADRIYTEYNGTIDEAVRRKKQMTDKGFTVIREETGRTAPGCWIKVVYLRPEK